MRGNSRRNPSALTSTMAAGSPLTRASNRWTIFRGERRTGLSSMRAIDTKQDGTCELDRSRQIHRLPVHRRGSAIGCIANENVRGSRVAPAVRRLERVADGPARIRNDQIEWPCADFARGRFHGRSVDRFELVFGEPVGDQRPFGPIGQRHNDPWATSHGAAQCSDCASELQEDLGRSGRR